MVSPWRYDAVALKNAAGVGVHDEDGMIAGVEQDGVGGLRAHAAERQEFRAELVHGLGEHAVERATILFVKKTDERLQPLRLLPEISRRPDQLLQSSQRNLAKPLHAEGTRAAQVDDCFFHVAPVGVLREVSAHDDFQPRLCRPPVLRTPAVEESTIVS